MHLYKLINLHKLLPEKKSIIEEKKTSELNKKKRII